jgi:hypothetical protein
MNIVLTSMRYKSKGHFDENVSWTCCILRWIPDKWDRIYLSGVLKNKITNHLFGFWDQKAFSLWVKKCHFNRECVALQLQYY